MQPLTGLRILDFSTLLPGPWATAQLQAMGAQVTRIESPQHPDLLRAYPNAFRAMNAEKNVQVLDLKSASALETVKKLLRDHDILLEQFRPGVMSRLGLGYEQLASEFPALIYCSLTGYGQTGALAHKAGHDINYQALSGLASYNGAERPVTTAVPMADIAGGSYPAMLGMLAAVIERQRTGLGQHLDIAMADGALALHTMLASEVLAGQPSPLPNTGLLNGGSFYDYYQCADDQWLAFGGLEPKFYTAFCAAVERPDWLALFKDLSAPAQRQLKQEISDLFLSNNRQHWLTLLSVDACIEPVLNLAEALAHPHFRARGMIQENDLGEQKLAVPIRFHT